MGAGTDNEDDALTSTDNKLDFNTDDWEEGDGDGIVTDDDGNYMRVAPTNLLFAPTADDVHTSKIKMTTGCTWSANVSKGGNDFEIVPNVGDTETLTVKSKNVGDRYFSTSGEITITGRNASGTLSAQLTQKVYLIQYSLNQEISMLSVDSKQSDFEVEVPGDGAILKYQIITGSQMNNWTATANNNANSMLMSYTDKGANGSWLELQIKPNLTADGADSKLTGKIEVAFVAPSGVANTIAPITITFNQTRSVHEMSISPAYTDTNPYIRDIFEYDYSGHNKIFTSQIFVNIIDKTKIATYTVTSNFDIEDLALNPSSSATTANLDTFTSKSDVTSFMMFLYPTAPGDLDIEGSITITPNYTDGTSGRGFSFPVTLTTGAVLARPAYYNAANTADPSPVDGHVWLWANAEKTEKLYIYDRNDGVYPPSDLLPIAYNYSFLSSNVNQEYKGEVWSSSDKKNGILVGQDRIYPYYTGWRLPSRSDAAIIINAIHFSKKRAFIMSDGLEGDKNVGTFLPSTSSSTFYWLDVHIDGININIYSKKIEIDKSASFELARAVRTVTVEAPPAP